MLKNLPAMPSIMLSWGPVFQYLQSAERLELLHALAGSSKLQALHASQSGSNEASQSGSNEHASLSGSNEALANLVLMRQPAC